MNQKPEVTIGPAQTVADSHDDTSTTAPPTISRDPNRSLWAHCRLFLRVWWLKIAARVVFATLRTFRISGFALRPSYVKHYPIGCRMGNDVWVPPATSAESETPATKRLPLYIDIHGGGFTIGEPRMDAAYCKYLSSELGIIVVSVNYPKAPLCPFPHMGEELAKVVKSVLDDDSLPVDKSKVVLGGFSAGANLSLSIAQRDEFQGKFQGLLLWYPVTDLSGQYTGEFRVASDGSHDILASTGPVFRFAYVPPDQDLTDPLLSPVYADRKKLPPKIFFLCAEYDYLSHETEKTAELFAAHEADTQARIGDENDWTIGNIRFKRYLDVQHGFNFQPKWQAEAERHRAETTKAAYADCTEWLKEIYL